MWNRQGRSYTGRNGIDQDMLFPQSTHCFRQRNSVPRDKPVSFVFEPEVRRRSRWGSLPANCSRLECKWQTRLEHAVLPSTESFWSLAAARLSVHCQWLVFTTAVALSDYILIRQMIRLGFFSIAVLTNCQSSRKFQKVDWKTRFQQPSPYTDKVSRTSWYLSTRSSKKTGRKDRLICPRSRLMCPTITKMLYWKCLKWNWTNGTSLKVATISLRTLMQKQRVGQQHWRAQV